MVKLYESGNFSIDFRVVRAYTTSKEVQERYGIIADFSAKTVVNDGKKEKVLTSHNKLRLVVDKEGHLYVSSDHAPQKTYVDASGHQRITSKVFYFALLPGSDQTEESMADYDRVVNSLVPEIKEFIENVRKNKRDQATDRPIPKNVSALADLAPAKKTSTSEDIPF